MLTSGHDVSDARVYHREAMAAASFGAEVVLVGKGSPPPGPVRIVSLRAPRSRLDRFLAQPWRCVWAARRERADVIHLHDAELLAALPFIRLRWPRAKVVYDVHEDFAELMMVRDWIPARARPAVRVVLRFLEHLLARLAHGIVAVTAPLADRFPHRHKAVVSNYPPAAYASAAHPKPAAERAYDVIHVGTLSRPRAEFLLDVLGRLRPGARSLIVGIHDELMPFMQAHAPDGVELRGRVPFEQVPGLVGDSRVGIDVHPWLTPHLLPALPVKVIEYLLSGCAVVTSRLPVLEGVLDEAGADRAAIRTVDGDDPADYAAAVDAMLDVDGSANRALAERSMVWEVEAEKLVGLYRALVGR